MLIRKFATTSPLSSSNKIFVAMRAAVEVVVVPNAVVVSLEMIPPTSGLTMKTSSRSLADRISTTSEVPGTTRVNGGGASQCLTKPGGTSSLVVWAIGVAEPVVSLSLVAMLGDNCDGSPGEYSPGSQNVTSLRSFKAICCVDAMPLP